MQSEQLHEELSYMRRVLEEKNMEILRLHAEVARIQDERNIHHLEILNILMKQEEEKCALTREVETLKSELSMRQLKDKVSTLQELLDNCIQEKASLINRVNKLEDQIIQMKEAHAATELQAWQREAALLMAEKENRIATEARIAELQKRLAQAEGERAKLRQENQELKLKFDATSAACSVLENTVAQLGMQYVAAVQSKVQTRPGAREEPGAGVAEADPPQRSRSPILRSAPRRKTVVKSTRNTAQKYQ